MLLSPIKATGRHHLITMDSYTKIIARLAPLLLVNWRNFAIAEHFPRCLKHFLLVVQPVLDPATQISLASFKAGIM